MADCHATVCRTERSQQLQPCPLWWPVLPLVALARPALHRTATVGLDSDFLLLATARLLLRLHSARCDGRAAPLGGHPVASMTALRESSRGDVHALYRLRYDGTGLVMAAASRLADAGKHPAGQGQGDADAGQDQRQGQGDLWGSRGGTGTAPPMSSGATTATTATTATRATSGCMTVTIGLRMLRCPRQRRSWRGWTRRWIGLLRR